MYNLRYFANCALKLPRNLWQQEKNLHILIIFKSLQRIDTHLLSQYCRQKGEKIFLNLLCLKELISTYDK